MNAFTQLAKDHPELEYRAKTYIGALVALKGKHSFWPQDKLRWTNRGLEIMDEALAAAPEDVEALFIHSSTCYYLPFFFKRSEDSQAKFGAILGLLPSQYAAYDPQLVRNVVNFIFDHAQLDDQGREQLNQLQEVLGIAKQP
jgi:hypothetical protein